MISNRSASASTSSRTFSFECPCRHHADLKPEVAQQPTHFEAFRKGHEADYPILAESCDTLLYTLLGISLAIATSLYVLYSHRCAKFDGSLK